MSLSDDAQELQEAVVVLRDELVKTFYLIEITEWLNNLLLKVIERLHR